MSQPARNTVANASQADASPQPGNKPVDKIRIGKVTASIWNNPSEKGDFHSVTFERSYKDDGGKWHRSSSFNASDLLLLAKVSDLAHSKIYELRAADRNGQADEETA